MTRRDPNYIDVHVGSRIRMRRQLISMSQEKLGELLGITFGYEIQPYYYLIYAFCLIALAIGFVIRNSALGVTWQALRDDELAARTSGIRPLTFYLLAFGSMCSTYRWGPPISQSAWIVTMRFRRSWYSASILSKSLSSILSVNIPRPLQVRSPSWRLCSNYITKSYLTMQAAVR